MVVTTRVNSFRAAGSEIAKRADKFGEEMPKVRTAGNLAVGAAVVGAVSANMGGKSVFLSGVPSKVGVAMVPSPNDGVIVKMTGAAKLLEFDTPKHIVGSGYRTSVKVRKDGSTSVSDSESGTRMRMPDGRWATGPFMAGGSSGRHMFRDGVATIEPKATDIYNKGVRVAAVKAGFG